VELHELTELAENNLKIKNYRAMTSIVDGDIVFLHKIEPGIETHSFGIEVAKLAGIPQAVIDEARKLFEIDKAAQQQLTGKRVGPVIIEKEVHTSHPIITKLQEIDPNHLSPMEALALLGNLVKESKS
jgi:DNA mismatch repair protein MutS